MNVNARKNILKRVVGTFKQTEIVENQPVYDSYKDHINSFNNEVMKHTDEWLTITNVVSLYIEYLFKGIEGCLDDEKKVSGNYQDLIGEEKLLELAEELVAHVEGVPYSYEFKVPLPNVEVGDINSIELGEGIYIIKTEEDEDSKEERGLGSLSNVFLQYGSPELKPSSVYLKIESNGYYQGNLSDSACISAISILKQVIQMAKYQGILRSLPETDSLSDIFRRRVHNYNNIHGCKKGDTDNVLSILPIQLSTFLSKLVLNEGYGLVDVYIKGHEVDKLFITHMKDHIKVIKSSDPNAMPIQAALQWAFDAELTENETISFIQVCIGLESILGDDKKSQTLSATLADRCAYLLGKGVINRNKISKQFDKMYSVRSKLVHGRKVKLSKKEEYFLNWGKITLQRIVEKELGNFIYI